MENIQYIFNCGNDKIINCHGEHKVTTDDVLNCIFTILINNGDIILWNDESNMKQFYTDVKNYMDSLTGNMFSHFSSIQIDLEIAIGFLETQK